MICRIFSIDHGLMTAIVCCVYVLIQAVILGREFRLVSLLQNGVAVLFGWFVFLNTRLLSFFTLPDVYLIRLFCMIGGMAIMGFGIFLYLRAKLIPHPADGLLLAIQRKTGWKQQNAKICLDGTMTAIALGISLVSTGGIVGIREGTFVALLMIGKAMGFFSEHLGPKVDAFFRI